MITVVKVALSDEDLRTIAEYELYEGERATRKDVRRIVASLMEEYLGRAWCRHNGIIEERRRGVSGDKNSCQVTP